MVEARSTNTVKDVDIVEVLHMVAAFLEEQNLTKSAATLVTEARLSNLVEAATVGDVLHESIVAGEWPKVLNLVARHAFSESNEVYEALYAHLIMEMVCLDEKHLARIILDEQKEMLVPNWYQDLWSVLYENKKPFSLDKMKSDDEMPKIDDPMVQNSRKMLAKMVKQKLVVLKPPSDKLIDLIL